MGNRTEEGQSRSAGDTHKIVHTYIFIMAGSTIVSTQLAQSSALRTKSSLKPLTCTSSYAQTRKPLGHYHRRWSAVCQRSSNRGRAESLIVRAAAVSQRLPEALLFDCDGVLVDTERDGHRVAFNQTFDEEFGPGKHVWDVELYGELLKIGGGKERMMAYFSSKESEEPFASLKTDEERKEFLLKMHLRKTAIFMEMVESGQLPLRPGVKALVSEAIENDVKVAVCSTSNEKAVSAIVENMLGQDIAKKMPVYAGDMVPKKKPDPAIYLMAADKLGVTPENCVVVEDSHIGLCAAKSAGMRCVVTTLPYTEDEEFDSADAIFPCIGEGDSSNFKLIPSLTFPGPLFN